MRMLVYSFRDVSCKISKFFVVVIIALDPTAS